MKILYVTHQFLPEYTGGTEILTYKSAKGIIHKGHSASIFTGSRKLGPDKALEFEHYTYDGIPTYRYRYCYRGNVARKNPVQDEYKNPRAEGFYKNLISRIRPDLVHIYHLHYLSVSLVDISREFGIPVVFTATDYWMICPTCQLLSGEGKLCAGPDRHMANCLRHLAGFTVMGRLIDRVPRTLSSLLFRSMAPMARFLPGYRGMAEALTNRTRLIMKTFEQVDKVLVATSFMEQKLIEYGLTPDKIQRLPFGVGPIKMGNRPVRGKKEELRIGFIGNLHPHKGAHILCRAVRLLPESAAVIARVYGPQDLFPDYVRELKDIAHQDPRIHFCGTFHPDSLSEILEDLDVLVVPSLWYENTPLVIHSAQAAGLPVIATDVGGIREVVRDGVNGLLFAREDYQQLADRLMELYMDRERLENLSKNATRPLSMDGYVERLEEIYNRVLK